MEEGVPHQRAGQLNDGEVFVPKGSTVHCNVEANPRTMQSSRGSGLETFVVFMVPEAARPRARRTALIRMASTPKRLKRSGASFLELVRRSRITIAGL